MNRKDIEALTEQVNNAYAQYMAQYDESPIDSWESRRNFYEGHAVKDAGAVVIEAFDRLSANMHPDAAWIACRDALNVVSSAGDRYLDALPNDDDEGIENAISTNLGYSVVFGFLQNFDTRLV